MTAPSALSLLPLCHDEITSIDPDRWSRAFVDALTTQLHAYGRIFLPHLGRGRRRHLPERRYLIGKRALRADRQTVWFFDAQPQADWLDIAVSYPLEDIDDWLILFRPDQLPRSVAEILRPPLVPRLRKTLSARPWSIVDVCETAEGNLEFTDFMELINDHRWLKIDHRTDNGLFVIERWHQRERKELLRLQLDIQLQTQVSCDYPPSEDPLLIDPRWSVPPDTTHLIAIADVLDDIYATLRRLIRHHFKLDTDHLGPLPFWRDWPDELFEFDEREDPAFLHLAAQMAVHLESTPTHTAPILDRWLRRCIALPCCKIPFLGELHTTRLPDLYLDPSTDGQPPLLIPGGPLYIATPRNLDYS